jgi:hypothetical protein
MESIGACSSAITEHVSFMANNSVLISLISSFKLKINKILLYWFVFMFMVPKAIFDNIQAISWRLVLLVEETGENH